jgi:hypothetical protein
MGGQDKAPKNGKPGKAGKNGGNKKSSSKTVSDFSIIMGVTSMLVVGLNAAGVI